MQDPTSGAQVVPPSPESPIPSPSVEPVAQPVVASEPILDAQPNPPVFPTSIDTITAQPSTPPIVETTTSAETAHGDELYPIKLPDPEEPQVAPKLEAHKSEEQPTTTMAESLPTGNDALLQRATLEAPTAQTLPGEESATQPIEPEAPSTTATDEPAQSYEPLIPPQPEATEDHGKAPETTGASMAPLATPVEIAQLTEATKLQEEVVAAPLPVQPETPLQEAVVAPSTPAIPEATSPPEATIDFSSVLQAQQTALLEKPEALAEKPAIPSLVTDEEVSMREVPLIKRSDRLETATGEQLEDLIGSGSTK